MACGNCPSEFPTPGGAIARGCWSCILGWILLLVAAILILQKLF